MTRALVGAGLLAAYLAGQGVSVAITGRLGGRGADGTDQSRQVFQELPTPDWAPPPATYGIVWSGLALTSSAAAYRVVQAAEADPSLRPAARRALVLWGAAIVPRTAYTPLAFGERRLWAATADSALLAATWTAFAVQAAKVDRAAAALAVPEALWGAFATVLSAATARRGG